VGNIDFKVIFAPKNSNIPNSKFWKEKSIENTSHTSLPMTESCLFVLTLQNLINKHIIDLGNVQGKK